MHHLLAGYMYGDYGLVLSKKEYHKRADWMQKLLPGVRPADFAPPVEDTRALSFLEWMQTYSDVLHCAHAEFTPIPLLEVPPLPANPRLETLRLFEQHVPELRVNEAMTNHYYTFQDRLENAGENEFMAIFHDLVRRIGPAVTRERVLAVSMFIHEAVRAEIPLRQARDAALRSRKILNIRNDDIRALGTQLADDRPLLAHPVAAGVCWRA